MKTKTTWILVADGAQARILCAHGRRNQLEQVPECKWEIEHPADRDIYPDRAGRTFDSIGDGRHAMEAPSSPHRRHKAKFAGRLVEFLEEHHRNKTFDRLILIAPPATLGDLREKLSKKLSSSLLTVIPKDLTRASNEDVSAHLEQHLYA